MMHAPSGDEELDLPAFRVRLRKMSDEQLLRCGRDAAYMASPAASYGPMFSTSKSTATDGPAHRPESGSAGEFGLWASTQSRRSESRDFTSRSEIMPRATLCNSSGVPIIR
jgi:hypothetical protein